MGGLGKRAKPVVVGAMYGGTARTVGAESPVHHPASVTVEDAPSQECTSVRGRGAVLTKLFRGGKLRRLDRHGTPFCADHRNCSTTAHRAPGSPTAPDGVAGDLLNTEPTVHIPACGPAIVHSSLAPNHRYHHPPGTAKIIGTLLWLICSAPRVSRRKPPRFRGGRRRRREITPEERTGGRHAGSAVTGDS